MILRFYRSIWATALEPVSYPLLRRLSVVDNIGHCLGPFVFAPPTQSLNLGPPLCHAAQDSRPGNFSRGLPL
jgi:hypothetical protein